LPRPLAVPGPLAMSALQLASEVQVTAMMPACYPSRRPERGRAHCQWQAGGLAPWNSSWCPLRVPGPGALPASLSTANLKFNADRPGHIGNFDDGKALEVTLQVALNFEEAQVTVPVAWSSQARACITIPNHWPRAGHALAARALT
jgi:hypothetical protein